LFCCAVSALASSAIVPEKSLPAFSPIADQMLRYSTVIWLDNSPSNYLHTYFSTTVGINDPTGWGLTNVPYSGLTNQIPTFGISNIPVYINGTFVYTPAINRILQLAANICEATTNAPNPSPAFFPSVYRPVFERDEAGNIFIVGYQQVSNVIGINDPAFSRPYDI